MESAAPRAAAPRRGWLPATISGRVAESDSAVTLTLDIPQWAGAIPGQHVDVRLTAPDGYQASRSYSLSAGPDEPPAITIQRVDGGEVSSYFVEVAQVGDQFEVLGPLGGYFVWKASADPVLLIGGGSGIVPMRSMWRARQPQTQMTVLYSVQGPDRVIFGDDLAALDIPVRVHYTRASAEDIGDVHWDAAQGRVDAASVAAALAQPDQTDVFICGPTAFVDAAADSARAAGVPPLQIRTERFG